MADWVGRTAVEIAAAVRAGDARARDVVAGHLDRIGKLNAELGAFVRVRPAAALSEAEEVDRRPDRDRLPLAGVPVAIKDNLPVAGEPMRSGSLAAPDVPQAKDHPVVARLRDAGAVVVGMTNLPELGIYPFTDSGFGIARNPWDRGRTPGGSSGGSAAAVAAALVPVAAQRGHLAVVCPDDRRVEPGRLPGRRSAHRPPRRRPAQLGPARHRPGRRIIAARCGRPARTRPRLAPARPRLRPLTLC
jgi:hypothetical protein